MAYSNSDSKDQRPPGLVPNPVTPLNASPPAYGTSTSQIYHATPPHPSPAVVPVAWVYERPPPARRRFWHAALFAIIAWILLAGLFKSFHLRWPSGSGSHGPVEIPYDITVKNCLDTWELSEPNNVAGASYARYVSSKSFDLPLDSEALFLISQGKMISGFLEVDTSGKQPSDVATVNVVVRYNRDDIDEVLKVCSVTRRPGEYGVGIFSPRRWSGWVDNWWRINYEIRVTLPARSNVKKFETDLVNAAQNVVDPASSVFFDSVHFLGSNGGIFVKSMRARDARLHTSNGKIQGSFNASESLTLESSNGSVEVEVALGTNDEGRGTCDIKTSNAAITAGLSLSSGKKTSSRGSSFRVSTQTSNGGLDVSFPHAPVDSQLFYGGHTSNARARVALNPAYEGTFHAQTSNAALEVEENQVSDPAGRGRQRKVHYNLRRKTEAFGDVTWDQGGRPADKGTVSVVSSNGRVVLQL